MVNVVCLFNQHPSLFGNEKYNDYIKEHQEEVKKILAVGDYSIQLMTNLIYMNDDLPQNQTA